RGCVSCPFEQYRDDRSIRQSRLTGDDRWRWLAARFTDLLRAVLVVVWRRTNARHAPVRAEGRSRRGSGPDGGAVGFCSLDWAVVVIRPLLRRRHMGRI